MGGAEGGEDQEKRPVYGGRAVGRPLGWLINQDLPAVALFPKKTNKQNQQKTGQAGLKQHSLQGLESDKDPPPEGKPWERIPPDTILGGGEFAHRVLLNFLGRKKSRTVAGRTCPAPGGLRSPGKDAPASLPTERDPGGAPDPAGPVPSPELVPPRRRVRKGSLGCREGPWGW